MTEFERRGHWRTSAQGKRHWVTDHQVNRDGLSESPTSTPWEPVQDSRRVTGPHPMMMPNRFSDPTWKRLPEHPNAVCPVCEAWVWFFRDRNGGCAYFDAVGKPWPIHPCMRRMPSLEGNRARQAAIAHATTLLQSKVPTSTVRVRSAVPPQPDIVHGLRALVIAAVVMVMGLIGIMVGVVR